MGCGCNKKAGTPVAAVSPVSQAMFQMELSMKPDFKQVIYNGPNYSHLVPSRTGVIAKLGMRDYGVGKKGSALYVHIDDITAYPELYQLVERPQIEQQETVLLTEKEDENSEVDLLEDENSEVDLLEDENSEVDLLEDENSEVDLLEEKINTVEILTPKKSKKRKV